MHYAQNIWDEKESEHWTHKIGFKSIPLQIRSRSAPPKAIDDQNLVKNDWNASLSADKEKRKQELLSEYTSSLRGLSTTMELTFGIYYMSFFFYFNYSSYLLIIFNAYSFVSVGV